MSVVNNYTENYFGRINLSLGNTAQDVKKNRILPRHIQLAIHKDEELEKYLGNTTIAQGGVLPGIANQLLPTQAKARTHGAAAPASRSK